jgi:8-oxo-dGTP diphosphatase
MSTVGVFASIFDSSGRILLVRHGYGSKQWSTPGGRIEPGESPIGVYAKPYRDDLVLSFHAMIVSGIPRACPPEISDAVFCSRDSLPSQLAFTRRIRVEDAFEGCRGTIRTFDGGDSLAPSFEADVLSHT